MPIGDISFKISPSTIIIGAFTLLFSVVSYFARDYLDRADDFRKNAMSQISNNSARLTVVEVESRERWEVTQKWLRSMNEKLDRILEKK